jgi:polyamine oxidase
MHETSHNILVPMIPKLGLKYYYDDGAPLYYTPYGPAGSQFKGKKAADEFADHCEWFYETNPDAPDRSAQEFIREYVDSHPLLSKEERMWAPSALREMEQWVGVNTELASAKHLAYYITERNLYVTGGYDTVVRYYSKPLIRDGHIKMGYQVSDIKTFGDNHVVISGSDSDGESFDLSANAVIVTVPLGVLKRDLIKFSPPLPADIQYGISKNSYHALGKIFFEFEEVFWSKERDQIIYYPKPDATLEDMDDCLSQAFVMSNLWVVEGIPELCIQTASPLTEKLEQLNHQQLYEYFEPLFKIMRTEPYKDLPKMVSVEMTEWTKDKFAGYGTYSCVGVGDDLSLLTNALEAHKDWNVQFAGEHTSSDGNGCVHGAFATGQTAAINLLRRFRVDYDGDNSPIASPA